MKMRRKSNWSWKLKYERLSDRQGKHRIWSKDGLFTALDKFISFSFTCKMGTHLFPLQGCGDS